MTITTSGTNPVTVEASGATTTTSANDVVQANASIVGQIDSGATVDGFGLELVALPNTATISVTNAGAVSTNQNSNIALLLNAGTSGTLTYSGSGNVTNTGSGGTALSVTNSGTGNVDVTISGTSTISASTTGDGIVASTTGTGTADVTVQSGGTVTGQGGVSLGGGVDTLDNSGTVQGIGMLSIGVTGLVATVTNSATISGTVGGVDVNNLTLTNNSGATIETTGTTSTEAAEAAVVAVTAVNAADITNKSGATIAATGQFGQIGILVGGTGATGNATVGNAGTISGAQDGVNTNTSGTTSITNSGSITATGSTSITARSGVRANTAMVENDKGGIISGLNGIFFRNDPTANQVFGPSSVFNDGTITGTGATAGFGTTPIAIHFSAGSTGNTLTLGTDSVINGNVLGAGSDIFQLGGTGSASFDLSNIGAAAQYQGFSTFNKIDTSTWTLTGTGANGWTVEQGTLQVDGTIGDTTVQSGATLDGTGTTGALTVDSGGTLVPGDDPGTITTGNLDLQAGSTLSTEIEGTSPGVGGFSQMVVNGSVTLAGTLSTSFLNGFTPQVGDSFEIINNDGTDAVTGTFAGLPEGASFTLGGTTFSITYKGGTGNDVVLTAQSNVTVSLSGQAVLSSATEGTAIVSGTHVATFSDTNVGDTASGFTASINWGDGTTDTGAAVTIVGGNGSFTVEGAHTYADEGSEPLSVTLIRTADNTSATATGSVSVADADNLSVTADNVGGNPGVAINNVQVASFTDAFAGQVASDLQATIDWGDGTASAGTVSETGGTFTVTGSHTYATGGNFTFNVNVDDAGGASATATGTAAVNFAGQMVLTTATEGAALPNNTPVATFSDSNSGDAAASFTAMIEWGDGATSSGTVTGMSATPGGTTRFTVSGGHTYADEGSDTATVILTRTADQASATASGAVAVAETDALTPHGTSFTANAHQTFSGTVAKFDDTGFPANDAGDFSASIDWGDGQTTSGTLSGGSGSLTVNGQHTYAAAGQDTVKVTLADDAPGSAKATATTIATVNQSASFPFDLNGDTISDLVFQNNGQPGVWLWNGTAPITEVGLTNPGAAWHIITSRDVNGDGNADLVWQNTDGTPGIWLMNGTTPTAEVGLTNPGPSWHVVASGDTNGDGKSDLIWQNSDGTLGVWLMNGTTPTAEVGLSNPGANWKVIGTADYNGDNNEDILLQDKTTGNLMIDLMNGTTISSSKTITVGDPSWHAVSTGEFNGQAEIAWQNNNGQAGIWLMNGTTPAAEAGLQNPGAGWQLLSVDHFTANGHADLLFQNTSGALQLWELNGTNIAAETNLPNPGTGWQSVNGHPFAAG
jgi:FG-GAP-like repeat